ncbi:MAG: DMT family transporter [Pseudomonadota bacterium]
MPFRTTPIQFAVLAMLLASALIAVTTLIAKLLGQPLAGAPALHPFVVSAGRFVFALSALLAVLSLRPRLRVTLSGARFDHHLARALCGWLGVTALFAASAQMPLAEATAISFLSPLVTMALALLFLGEGATRRKLVAAALAVFGALTLLQPGTDAFQPAAFLALAAAALLGVEAIFIKLLSDREPPMRILVINNVIGAAFSLTAAAFVWSWPTLPQWVLLVAIGVVMVAGQAYFIQAMKGAAASTVIPVFYSTLAFAAFYDFVLFGVRPTGDALFGCALIALGAWALSTAPKAHAEAASGQN